MSKVLLSDIDGTLVDSNSLHADSWRRAFEHFGIDVSLDETWSQIGKGGDEEYLVFMPGSISRHRALGIAMRLKCAAFICDKKRPRPEGRR